MKFDPEDQIIGGPRCRNCHRGSSGCGSCHNSTSGITGGINPVGIPSSIADADLHKTTDPLALDQGTGYMMKANWLRSDIASFFRLAFGDTMMTMFGQAYNTANYISPGTTVSNVNNDFVWTNNYNGWLHSKGTTTYNFEYTSDAQDNEISQALDMTATDNKTRIFKTSQTVDWNNGWRTDDGQTMAVDCGDDGFSWPHRTLGYMMLKDDLFGLDFDGTIVEVGSPRQGLASTHLYGISATYADVDLSSLTSNAHDIDSVCLDCHNPTVYRATSALDHTDDPNDANDDYDDDTLLRGLP